MPTTRPMLTPVQVAELWLRLEKRMEPPGKIETFFTSSNFLFSTKEEKKNRQETLYFKDPTTNQTGRLRQEHPKGGPLAKIDKKEKRHWFVSEKRFKRLKQFHKKHRYRHPRFCSDEQQPKDGKHHIDFAWDGKKVSRWHASRGTVVTNYQHLDRRIASALKNILGIR